MTEPTEPALPFSLQRSSFSVRVAKMRNFYRGTPEVNPMERYKYWQGFLSGLGLATMVVGFVTWEWAVMLSSSAMWTGSCVLGHWWKKLALEEWDLDR